MESRQIKVMVVDDDERLCAAWSRLLAAQDDLALVGAFESADEMVAAVAHADPDVVLLDLTMPGADPLASIARVIAARPDTKVLIYSGHNDAQTEQRVARAGARGLVDKLESPQEIIAAIRRVAAGELCFRHLSRNAYHCACE